MALSDSLVVGTSVPRVPVPGAGPGVCARCHGPARRGRVECYCCVQVGRVLGEEGPDAGPPVVAMSLCRPGDELHGALRRYKDAPAVAARHHFAGVVARFAQDFLAGHGDCLEAAAGGWDGVVVVPSSGRGPVSGRPVCPFEAVVGEVPPLAEAPRVWLRRGRTPARHLAPSPHAFEVVGAAAGRRLLVVDDTWVTGARARSAACALSRAGASVVGILVVGRAVEPSAGTRTARWWERHRRETAGVGGRCCLPGCLARSPANATLRSS